MSADTLTGLSGSGGIKGDPAEEEQSSSTDNSSGLEHAVAATIVAEQTETERRVIQLKSQLSTLTNSLATVTQEKSRMEASFQADKRKMKQELEEVREKMEEMLRRHQSEQQTLQEQLAESRARVITQQHEREQEHGDHAHMLRELQKLLQEERSSRQDLELKLEESRDTLAESTRAVDRGLEYEERLKESMRNCEVLRKSLQAAEAERSKPDLQVQELQEEITHLKTHFNQQLQLELKKVVQAEESFREQVQLEGRRVASLEERVSELSELLGTCEKAKQKDQQVIQRLRERVLQLDAENKTLALATSATRTTSSDLVINDGDLDLNTLKDKLEKVKKLMQLAARRSPEQSLEIEKLLEGKDDEQASVQVYQQELRQLKEEFERYKLRAQVVLKNKNTKDGTQAKELEEARDQLSELKEKYINLRVQSDEAEAKHKRQCEDHQQALSLLQQTHKQDFEKLEAQHREDLLHIEEELHKQRARTMALLEEKDLELEKLRAVRDQNTGLATTQRAEPGARSDSSSSASDECETLALKLALPNEPTMLLYAEQLARNEVEISALRKQKHRLEEDLHQLQGKVIANAERYDEELSMLRAQLDKQTRNTAREGANIEYLKNVIYRFLTLQDARGRQQTLTAILTVLHFSPQEKQAVIKQQGHSWWMSTKR